MVLSAKCCNIKVFTSCVIIWGEPERESKFLACIMPCVFVTKGRSRLKRLSDNDPFIQHSE